MPTHRQAVGAMPLRPKQIGLSTMSTIELVDPELRDVLALWP